METRFGRIVLTLLVIGDLVWSLIALVCGNPSARAWAWAFNLDAPLDLSFWSPVLLMARNLVFQMLHRGQ
jgi:hypothetical protein